MQRKDGSYVEISAQRAAGMRDRICGNYNVNEQNIEYKDLDVIYLNCYFKHWGHFLIDVIARLWYKPKAGKDWVYVYTSINNDCISGNFKEFINLLGIEEKHMMHVSKPTRFRTVIVPEMAIYPGLYYTKEYKDIFQTVIQNAGVQLKNSQIKEEKIYCSRRHLVSNAQNEFGEEWIEKAFADNGYKVVYMEEMTVKEQICTIHNAECVAMLSGTLMHNLLFARDGAKAIVCYKAYFKYINQHLINQISNVDFVPIDVWYLPRAVTTDGPFMYRIGLTFKKFAFEHGMNISWIKESIKISTLLQFWKRYIRVNWKRIIKGTTHIECDYTKTELKRLCNQIKRG